MGRGRKECDNRRAISQAEIASQLGVSERTLQEMLAIERKLTPEIKELLDNGVFTKTTASKILTKLSADEQAELAQMLPQDAKQRKIATEYVALCGGTHGDNQYKRKCDNRTSLTQEEIASQLGVSERTLQEMLAIERKLTPEIKELLDNGVFTKTTASKILTKLSADEQAELAQMLPQDAKQRKIATEYVALCGFKNGEMGRGRKVVDNRPPNLSQAEIASQLGISETSLKEILLIERKLTPEIKELQLQKGERNVLSARRCFVVEFPREVMTR